MEYWFFGPPGSGKSYVGGLFSQMTGNPLYDGDDFHTEEDRRVIARGEFTLAHRHPLPDRTSRERVRNFGSRTVQLVYVRAPLALTKTRLWARTNHHFDAQLLDAWLVRHWEEPNGEDCFVIENDLDSAPLEVQLEELRDKRT
jgi:gluconate kinase